MQGAQKSEKHQGAGMFKTKKIPLEERDSELVNYN
jgi:hypothetical protein